MDPLSATAFFPRWESSLGLSPSVRTTSQGGRFENLLFPGPWTVQRGTVARGEVRYFRPKVDCLVDSDREE
jgi:hypothetical protein